MSNNFKIVDQTLASAVATAGTITVTYPDNTTEGDFTTYDWFLVTTGASGGSNDVYSSKAGDFTVTLGDTAATLTWKSATTLAAGTAISVQANIKGTGDLEAKSSKMDEVTIVKRTKGQTLARVIFGNPLTADTDGILDGVSATDSATSYDSDDFASAYDSTNGLDVPRNLTAVGTAGSDHVITVTGEDEYGDVIIETLTLSGTTAIVGDKAFKKVTTVAVAAGAASDTFDMGWGDKLGIPMFLKDAGQIIAEYEDGSVLTAPATAGGKIRVPFQIDQTDCLAGTPISVPCPVAGTITKLTTIAWKAVTTGGAVTMKVNNTAVDGLSVTVADGGGAGDLDSDTPTAGHASTTVAVDDELEVICASEFATAGALTGYIEIEPSTTLSGTVVAGDETAPTATTGDVRGTYTPVNVANGSRTYEIDVVLVDPQNLGLDNYDG